MLPAGAATWLPVSVVWCFAGQQQQTPAAQQQLAQLGSSRPAELPAQAASTTPGTKTLQKKKKKVKKEKKKKPLRRSLAATASKKRRDNTSKKKKEKKTKHTAVNVASLCPDQASAERFQAAISCQLSTATCFFVYQLPSVLDGVAANMHNRVNSFLLHDQQHGSHALGRWPDIIGAAYPELDCAPDLDLMLVALCLIVFRNRGAAGLTLLDLIEYSSGSAMLTLQAILAGCAAVGLDKLYGDHQDNCHPAGLRLWLHQLSITRHGALLWFGTKCSSFSLMCRYTSQRTELNNYLGEGRTFVDEGNYQMQLTSLLFFLGHLLENIVCLEQPAGSVMPKTPPLSSVLSFIEATHVKTYHGAFGAESHKPLQLVSNSELAMELKRAKPKAKGKALVKRGRDGQFIGIKNRLEGSECYTAEFGKAVVSTFLVRPRTA